MKKEDLLKLINDNVPDGADIEMTIATKDDNYTADSDQPVINSYKDNQHELVLELPDIFEVGLVEVGKSNYIKFTFDDDKEKLDIDMNLSGEQLMLAYLSLKKSIEEESGLPIDLAELFYVMKGAENDNN